MQLNFVLCPSYHGATLLALLLNNHPDISSLGDTMPTPDFVQRCSCGEPVSTCPFWDALRQDMSHLPPLSETPEHIGSLPLFRPTGGTRATALAGILLGGRIPGWMSSNSRAWVERYLAFRSAVLNRQNTTIFVDGEKSVTRVMLLKGLLGPSATVRVLHLTRDPRGFYNSCKKYLPGAKADAVASMWLHHKKIMLLRRSFLKMEYLRIRYEDLCASPPETMQRILDFFHAPPADVLHAPEPMEKFHLMGNKMVHSFQGDLTLDTGWESGLTAEEQRDILRLTDPISTAYGYLPGSNDR